MSLITRYIELEHKTNRIHAHHHVHLELQHQQMVTRSSCRVRRHHSRETLARSRQKSQIQFFLFAAFAYILSPIDIIPEMIFGIFGMIDDVLFLLLCFLCIAIILIYPIFREMQRTILDKLGIINKKF